MTINEQEQRLKDLLQPPPAPVVSPTSRYAAVGTAVFDPDSDRPVAYLLRRFVPHPERLADLGTYVVVAGDRTDRAAASAYGDPELFWRLCDGNRAVFPEELVEQPARRLRITAPEGTPGAAP